MGGGFTRRDILAIGGALPLTLGIGGCDPHRRRATSPAGAPLRLDTKAAVPAPENVFFTVQPPGRSPIRLAAHYWFDADARQRGVRCPAIVEFLPYRRRDGTMLADSRMYPWFAANEYLCFRVDLQGSGDSEGVLTDEYTDDELLYCTQVIAQIAAHPACDGNVGMMGKSWSAINSLMVAARRDRPAPLKAIIVCCGSDDRWSDDVHYMGGAMMFDNVSWPSSMFGWLSLPPDPAVVGDAWQSMWRERIRNADYWFRRWAENQPRDDYWSDTAVRDHWTDVGVPVFVLAGWQDGYKNPVDRIVRGVGAAGQTVQGLLGPWGHKYPFNGYPGPRLDWLGYTVTHWWDRWLKGKAPDPDTTWPEMPVWLGASKEPDKSPCADEEGRWVAEDRRWPERTQELRFHLGSDHRLAPTPSDATYVSPEPLVLATAMLETSSWGECGNDDLPGDQRSADLASLYFDSEPLADDVDVFGYPAVHLRLAADAPIVSLAVRLCEISPTTGASHLVTYRFFNVAYRKNELGPPVRLVPNAPTDVDFVLNLTGHTFKRGWRVRLSVSPSFFPTMWQGATAPRITLHTRSSTLGLPVRPVRPDEDARAQRLLPAKSASAFVEPEDYVPILDEARPAQTTRDAEPIEIDGRRGMRVTKVFDNGNYHYGGALQGLWVDQAARESFELMLDDPLSMTGTASSTATLSRPDSSWRARSETEARVWSERDATGAPVFRYAASVRTFVTRPDGTEEPFEAKTVSGKITRRWV
jgi:predicted acyl esterase